MTVFEKICAYMGSAWECLNPEKRFIRESLLDMLTPWIPCNTPQECLFESGWRI